MKYDVAKVLTLKGSIAAAAPKVGDMGEPLGGFMGPPPGFMDPLEPPMPPDPIVPPDPGLFAD